MSSEIKVLIIEDNRNYLRSIEQALTLMEGVCFAGGLNSVEAVEDTAVSPPDVILLDINLPGRSGLEALPEIGEGFN